VAFALGEALQIEQQPRRRERHGAGHEFLRAPLQLLECLGGARRDVDGGLACARAQLQELEEEEGLRAELRAEERVAQLQQQERRVGQVLGVHQRCGRVGVRVRARARPRASSAALTALRHLLRGRLRRGQRICFEGAQHRLHVGHKLLRRGGAAELRGLLEHALTRPEGVVHPAARVSSRGAHAHANAHARTSSRP
jgi:hypothetical protein